MDQDNNNSEDMHNHEPTNENQQNISQADEEGQKGVEDVIVPNITSENNENSEINENNNPNPNAENVENGGNTENNGEGNTETNGNEGDENTGSGGEEEEEEEDPNEGYMWSDNNALNIDTLAEGLGDLNRIISGEGWAYTKLDLSVLI